MKLSKNLSYNLKNINEKQTQLNNKHKKYQTFVRLRRIIIISGLTITPLFLCFYIINSSNFLQKIQLANKFKSRKKNLEDLHGVNTREIENKLTDFDNEWNINKKETEQPEPEKANKLSKFIPLEKENESLKEEQIKIVDLPKNEENNEPSNPLDMNTSIGFHSNNLKFPDKNKN